MILGDKNVPDQGDEYRTLREEILQGQNRREQVFNYVLTAVATIFGFSIQFHTTYLPLVALVPLSFGMVQISYIANSMSRAADYIRLALEPNANLQWEQLNYEFQYKDEKSLNRISSFKIINYTLLILGVIACSLPPFISPSFDLNTFTASILILIGWLLVWFTYRNMDEKIRSSNKTFWAEKFPQTSSKQPEQRNDIATDAEKVDATENNPPLANRRQR